MTEHNHAVVWMDHREARILHFSADDVQTSVVHPHGPHLHVHHRADSIGAGDVLEDQAFFNDVIKAIGGSKAVLVIGPGMAKTAFIKHIARHVPQMMENIAGVETASHPTDGEVIALARTYFWAADRMTPQLGPTARVAG